jgi:hypothetical protein
MALVAESNILPVGGSDNDSPSAVCCSFMKNTYLEEHFDTCIYHFLNTEF